MFDCKSRHFADDNIDFLKICSEQYTDSSCSQYPSSVLGGKKTIQISLTSSMLNNYMYIEILHFKSRANIRYFFVSFFFLCNNCIIWYPNKDLDIALYANLHFEIAYTQCCEALNGV